MSEDLLKQSKENERLARSAIKRLANEPYERRFGPLIFSSEQKTGRISDTITMLRVLGDHLEKLNERIGQLNDRLDNLQVEA